MYVYKTDDFPYVEFGSDIKRQIRMIFSPDIGNAKDVNIVVCKVPPNGVSEGHVHDDCDEIIHFNIEGKAVINGSVLEVPANSFVYASKGQKHECINISEHEELQLMCIFLPAFQPYGKYPVLIKETISYLEGQ